MLSGFSKVFKLDFSRLSGKKEEKEQKESACGRTPTQKQAMQKMSDTTHKARVPTPMEEQEPREIHSTPNERKARIAKEAARPDTPRRRSFADSFRPDFIFDEKDIRVELKRAKSNATLNIDAHRRYADHKRPASSKDNNPQKRARHVRWRPGFEEPGLSHGAATPRVIYPRLEQGTPSNREGWAFIDHSVQVLFEMHPY